MPGKCVQQHKLSNVKCKDIYPCALISKKPLLSIQHARRKNLSYLYRITFTRTERRQLVIQRLSLITWHAFQYEIVYHGLLQTQHNSNTTCDAVAHIHVYWFCKRILKIAWWHEWFTADKWQIRWCIYEGVCVSHFNDYKAIKMYCLLQ